MTWITIVLSHLGQFHLSFTGPPFPTRTERIHAPCHLAGCKPTWAHPGHSCTRRHFFCRAPRWRHTSCTLLRWSFCFLSPPVFYFGCQPSLGVQVAPTRTLIKYRVGPPCKRQFNCAAMAAAGVRSTLLRLLLQLLALLMRCSKGMRPGTEQSCVSARPRSASHPWWLAPPCLLR